MIFSVLWKSLMQWFCKLLWSHPSLSTNPGIQAWGGAVWPRWQSLKALPLTGTKMTTIYRETIGEKNWKTCQKDLPHLEIWGRSHTRQVRGVELWCSRDSRLWVGAHKREDPDSCGASPARVRGPSPTQGFVAWGVLYREEKPPEPLALMASEACTQECWRAVGNRYSIC